MIKSIVLLLTISLTAFYANSQVVIHERDTTEGKKNEFIFPSDTIEEEKDPVTDIVYKHDGTKMLVNVKKIYINDLFYSLPGETKVNKMDQRLVHKIEYKTGKIEILNEKPKEITEVKDYRKVKITEDPDDIEGLIEVSKLEAKAEGSDRGFSTPKSLDRTAQIILRRKAALLNANIVLITGRKSNVAFGEVPSVTLTGTAYSYR